MTDSVHTLTFVLGESGFGNSELPGECSLGVNPVVSPKCILIPFGSVDEVNNSWLIVNYFVKQQRIIRDGDFRSRG